MEKKKSKEKQRVLIVDDSSMNREMLAAILENEFEILEASNGAEALKFLKKYENGISIVLLDIVMPVMDGFEVLAYMNKYHWIDQIPVIMISSENAASYVERAYDLGVTEYISRPYDIRIVHRRVKNTIMLYAKQRKLVDMVSDQIYQKEQGNQMMISILSHIVEFRNGESGLHVLHINTLTGLLFDRLIEKTDRYGLTSEDRSLITSASSLHDIGKIGIDDAILNKPGRLTDEEFAIMKTHSAIGASMIKDLDIYKDEPLIKVAYEICRWHHERYDGKGYPDGLKGEEIPISAQLVSLADVYDALTSERVYKKAFTHEKAIQMILNGECGTFNPLLLECLMDIQDTVRDEMAVCSVRTENTKDVKRLTEEVLKKQDISMGDQTEKLLELERTKNEFYASISRDIRYDYTENPPVLSISKFGAEKLGLKDVILDPINYDDFCSVMEKSEIHRFLEEAKKTTPQNPVFEFDGIFRVNGKKWNAKLTSYVLWSEEDETQCTGWFGKAVVSDEK